MSTRCQVQVIQEGMGDWDAKITLYHHSDGYPNYMLPCIEKAYQLSGGQWEAGRAGKVASFLCAADPGQFEPEAGHSLHGDIEYFYKLYCLNGSNGSLTEHPRWEIAIYKPKDGFWDKPTLSMLKCVMSRRPLAAAIESQVTENNFA